jgi:hypothetical protein
MFANDLLKDAGELVIPISRPKSSILCSRCIAFDLKPAFRIIDNVAELIERAKTCDLCRMLWAACVKLEGDKKSTVVFERDQSKLRMNGLSYPPALSICRSPGKKPTKTLDHCSGGLGDGAQC